VQLRPVWIERDVTHDFEEMVWVPDDSVVTLALPKRTLAMQMGVDLFCRKAFPRLQDVFQVVISLRSHGKMHMIGHYSEGMEMVSLPVEVV